MPSGRSRAWWSPSRGRVEHRVSTPKWWSGVRRSLNARRRSKVQGDACHRYSHVTVAHARGKAEHGVMQCAEEHMQGAKQSMEDPIQVAWSMVKPRGGAKCREHKQEAKRSAEEPKHKSGSAKQPQCPRCGGSIGYDDACHHCSHVGVAQARGRVEREAIHFA